jgi:DNA-binding NarL/FixJ family response regulator
MENSHVEIEKAVKVLIVEDDPSDAKLVRSTLSVSVQRYDTEVADCISTAIERLQASTFDVILLDMGLPDSQGIDTVSKVHNEYPDIPIVVLTGLDDDETGIRAVQIGAQDYLVKGSVSSEDYSLCYRAQAYGGCTQNIAEAIKRERRETAIGWKLDATRCR